jgi:hypothetical protein
LLAAFLTERVAAALVDGHAPAQVGQGEVDAPVAAVGGTEQGEQGLVLVDGKELAVTQRPALWRKTKGHDANLTQERLCHRAASNED